MLGVEPVSGNTVSDYPANYNLTLTLTGKVLNAFKGIIGDIEEIVLPGFRLTASQAPFSYFAATYYIAAQPALHAQRAAALAFYRGFSLPGLLSLQARQGNIQFQKLVYWLIANGPANQYGIAWSEDVNLYISEFGPETIRGTIYVYEDTQAWMHIEEEEFTF